MFKPVDQVLVLTWGDMLALSRFGTISVPFMPLCPHSFELVCQTPPVYLL